MILFIKNVKKTILFHMITLIDFVDNLNTFYSQIINVLK